jgi:hypothetical protein
VTKSGNLENCESIVINCGGGRVKKGKRKKRESEYLLFTQGDKGGRLSHGTWDSDNRTMGGEPMKFFFCEKKKGIRALSFLLGGAVIWEEPADLIIWVFYIIQILLRVHIYT